MDHTLVRAVIDAVASKKADFAIPAPEPVPAAILERLVLAEDVPLPPSLRAWLAFDGSWLARTRKWFREPSAPRWQPMPICFLVHEHLSKDLAPYFEDLPGKLARANALLLDEGSEHILVLAAVAGSGSECPVLRVSIDDLPYVSVEAPSFAEWLAWEAGLAKKFLPEAFREASDAVGRDLFGGKKSYMELPIPSAELLRSFRSRMREAVDEAKEAANELAEVWQPFAPPKGKKRRKGAAPVVPKLGEDDIGTAIAQAIEGQREDRARLLLDDAKARFPRSSTWKNEAIRGAVKMNDVVTTRELLVMGADVETRTYLDNRLVHSAASQGRTELLHVLIDAGANLEARGYRQQTPLHDACEERHADVVKMLLEHKVDIEARDHHDFTPLMLASRVFASPYRKYLPETIPVARLLLNAGANVNACGNNTTALHRALEQRNTELATLLIERGADVDAKNRQGQDGAQAAIFADDMVIVELLRRRRAPHDESTATSSDALVQSDGVTPETLSCAIRCSDARQRLHVDGAWIVTGPKGLLSRIADALRALASVAQAGMTGSDVFAPASCMGSCTIHWPNGGSERDELRMGQRIEASADVDIAGLSPAALAWWVRALCTVPLHPCVRLELRGEMGLDDSGLSVDTARASGWLRDRTTDVPAAWPGALDTVDRRPSKNRIARLRTARDASGPIHLFVKGFESVIRNSMPSRLTDLRDRRAWSRDTFVTTKESDAWNEIHGRLLLNEGSEDLNLDLLTIFPLFVNGIHALRSHHPVEAEWSLGVSAETATPPRPTTPIAGPPQLFAKAHGYPYAEVAKTGRSACVLCEKPIAKDTVRIAIPRAVETERGTKVSAAFVHLACARGREGMTVEAILHNSINLEEYVDEIRGALEG